MLLAWPPNYHLKVSSKAKYLQLKITHNAVLQVIVPYRQAKKITQQIIGEFIESKKVWITKHLTLSAEVALPEHLIFFNGTNLQIIYQDWHANSAKLVHNHLIIKSNEHAKRKALLIKWLKNYAKELLLPIVGELAAYSGLVPLQVNVKEQKNIWGNCSSHKIINLNYKLLFLPLYLVRYVILHELTHLEHLNHSSRFWNLLTKFDPLAREHDYQLKSANNYVPRWLLL